MADYTDDEKQQMRTAAFGAVFLVSKADPGMFDTLKESFAASKAIAKAPAGMQAIFKSGGIPKMPTGDASQLESSILADLQSSVAAISAKQPDDVESYRHVVLDACTSAAETAGGGVSSSETAALTKIKGALGVS